AGRKPTDDLRSGYGRCSEFFTVEGLRNERARPVLGALLAEVPGEEHEELVQVRDQRGMQVHLHTQILEGGHALRRRDPTGSATQLFFRYSALLRVHSDVERSKVREHLLKAIGVRRQPVLLHKAFL